MNYSDNRHSDAYTDQLKNGDFRIQGSSKRVNPPKSLFRKFDTKRIISLPYVSNKVIIKYKNLRSKNVKNTDFKTVDFTNDFVAVVM